MKAHPRAIKIVADYIATLEAELKTGPPKPRETRIQELLNDAHNLLDYMKDRVPESPRLQRRS